MMRRELGISLKIILNVIKCLAVPLVSLNPYNLAVAQVFFISFYILSEFTILPDMYILLFPWEEEVHSYSWGDGCIILAVHSPKRLNPLCTTILLKIELLKALKSVSSGKSPGNGDLTK